MSQKFKRGDEVTLSPAEMERVRWLIGDANRVFVEYSYRDRYGGGKAMATEYSLAFYKGSKQTNRISWFGEHHLTLKAKRTLTSIARLENHEEDEE